MEHTVDTCWSCPFAEKRDWSNEDDSGTDIEDCVLGHPQETPTWVARKHLGAWNGPPEWCKLRKGPVLVKLQVKKK